MNTIFQFDTNLLFLIHNIFYNHVFDLIMPLITALGNGGMIWIILSVVLLINKKYRKTGIQCAIALVLVLILGDEILKNLIQRPRPFVAMSNIQLLIAKPLSYSFPSGHTSASFAIVGIVWSKLRKIRIPVLILAVLIAFSRMYLFVHYPLDVFAGAMLGLICSRISISLSNHGVLIYQSKVNQ
ncbi:MAG: phosphatase PAP2 family protein [Bacillota bacterium]|nr:phosphatase PAP2 family protein [Bacillota bacterium]